jgi:hypothetical protein
LYKLKYEKQKMAKKQKTFWIEEKEWLLFREYCKKNNRSASAEILNFIQKLIKQK